MQQSAALAAAAAPKEMVAFDDAMAKKDSGAQSSQNSLNFKSAQSRKVSPQSQVLQVEDKAKVVAATDEVQNNLSRVVPAEDEFSQLIGSENDGMLARFLQNKLKLMFWHRLNREPDLVFGAQLNLNRVVDDLRDLVQTEPALRDEICLVLLDDNAKPVVSSRPNFTAIASS